MRQTGEPASPQVSSPTSGFFLVRDSPMVENPPTQDGSNPERGAGPPTEPSSADRKRELEVEKIAAEIAEITGRTEAQASKLTRFRTWAGILLSVVTLIAAVWGVWEGASRYFAEQERQRRQREKEYEFQLSKEMITLSSQLGSNEPIERANAALLLSAFEENSVAILVSHLRVTDKSNLERYLIASLKLILQKERIKPHPEKVFAPLRDEAEFALDQECRSPTPSVQAIANYIQALEELGAGTQDKSTLDTLAGLRAKIGSCSNVSALSRESLTTRVEKAVKAVSTRN